MPNPQQLEVLLIDTPPQSPPSIPDNKYEAEERAFESEKRGFVLRGLEQDLNERKTYASRIFVLICCWLGGMIGLLLLQGFLSVWGVFNLSEAVILAAIGGTTINVLGIFIIVVNYLFPRRPK